MVPKDFIELCDWAHECPDCAANEIWSLRRKLKDSNQKSEDYALVAEKLYVSIKSIDKDHDNIEKWLDVYDAFEEYILMKEKYND